MIVRPRLDADLPECVQVLREIHEADRYPDAWPADPHAWLLPDASAWVAVSEGRIVGHVAVVGRDDALWVTRLFAMPAARGQGVGETLLRTVRAQPGPVMLDVIEYSTAAIALYERLGWSLIDRRPAGWIMRDGTRPMERIYRAN